VPNTRTHYTSAALSLTDTFDTTCTPCHRRIHSHGIFFLYSTNHYLAGSTTLFDGIGPLVCLLTASHAQLPGTMYRYHPYGFGVSGTIQSMVWDGCYHFGFCVC
jgi:hypothetical protein